MLARKSSFEIADKQGFLICPPGSFHLSEHAVVEAEAIFVKHQADLYRSSSGKAYLQEIPLNGHLSEHSALMKFALDHEILGVVASYLKSVPVLREIRMMYSPNEGAFQGGSQLFHVDKEYPRMMKIFLFITPSGEQDGPLMALPADKSEVLWKSLGHFEPIHRLSDDQVFDQYSLEDTTAITGERGSVAFLDVARCLHFGSRPSSTSQPRLVVWFVYHHLCGAKLPFSLLAGKRFDFEEFMPSGAISEPIKSVLLR